jgi:hypothetical protein
MLLHNLIAIKIYSSINKQKAEILGSPTTSTVDAGNHTRHKEVSKY